MQQVVYVLVITFVVQCAVACGAFAVPVLLPAFANEVGVASGFAGVVMATIYSGAVVTAYLFSAGVERRGAIRSSQASLFMVVAGVALCAVGKAETIVLGALAIGLGFGPVTAASTYLLTRFTPTRFYGLVFSINRISVPAGAVLGAVILPMLSQNIGWKGALLVFASAIFMVALLLQLTRALDRSGEVPVAAVVRRAWLEPLRALLSDPRRRMLGKVALVYFAAQSCLVSFTVTFLVDNIGLSHVKAGAVLAGAQMAGVLARLVLGFISDRLRQRMTVIGCIGLLIALGTGMAALAQPDWPSSVVMATFALYGAGALGWNGVVIAELAHSSSPEHAGEVVGTFSAVTFLGAVLGPMLFSALLSQIGYAGGYGLIAGASAIAAIALIRFERSNPRTFFSNTAHPIARHISKAKDPL